VVVDAILDHPDIKAVSFVGSSDIAQYVYGRGAAAGKRMQCMGGAKNHGVVMPDADLDQTVADIMGAAYGSAGERCMALPVVVPVGEATAEALREKLIPAIEALRVGISSDPDAHYGPVVSAAHKARIEGYIQMAIDEGSELVVDGRGFSLQGYEDGYFLGPTLLDQVKPTMRSYQEEIFGPVLQIVRAADGRGGDGPRLPPPVRQRRGHLHPQRRRRPRVRRPGRDRDGRHQCADPGAGVLPLVRRLEALGLRRPQPVRHGRRALLHPHQDRDRPLAERRGGVRPELRHPDHVR
jgi:hypothetical protein